MSAGRITWNAFNKMIKAGPDVASLRPGVKKLQYNSQERIRRFNELGSHCSFKFTPINDKLKFNNLKQAAQNSNRTGSVVKGIFKRPELLRNPIATTSLVKDPGSTITANPEVKPGFTAVSVAIPQPKYLRTWNALSARNFRPLVIPESPIDISSLVKKRKLHTFFSEGWKSYKRSQRYSAHGRHHDRRPRLPLSKIIKLFQAPYISNPAFRPSWALPSGPVQKRRLALSRWRLNTVRKGRQEWQESACYRWSTTTARQEVYDEVNKAVGPGAGPLEWTRFAKIVMRHRRIALHDIAQGSLSSTPLQRKEFVWYPAKRPFFFSSHPVSKSKDAAQRALPAPRV